MALSVYNVKYVFYLYMQCVETLSLYAMGALLLLSAALLVMLYAMQMYSG